MSESFALLEDFGRHFLAPTSTPGVRMNYRLKFPIGIADPRLQRMMRELQTQFEAWKLRYRLGLTAEVLHVEITKWALEMGYLPMGKKDLERTIGIKTTPPVLNPWKPSKLATPSLGLPVAVITPSVVAKPVVLTLTFTFEMDSPASAFTHCPGCGAARVAGAQKVHSHSIVPASMWPVIVIEAMKALPATDEIPAVTATKARLARPVIPARTKIDPATFSPDEKKIVGRIADIGMSTASIGADDEFSSLCLACETLHGNMSLLQRYEASLIELDPIRKFKLVGLQFGATTPLDPNPPSPAALKEKVTQFTRNQLARVAARMDHEMRVDLPRHFTKQTTKDGTGNQLEGRALEDRLQEMYDSGQYTPFMPLVERLLLNIDQFMVEIRKQGLKVCSGGLPNDFSAYSSQYTMGM